MGFQKASIRYIDLLDGSDNGNDPPENVLDSARAQPWVFIYRV